VLPLGSRAIGAIAVGRVEIASPQLEPRGFQLLPTEAAFLRRRPVLSTTAQQTPSFIEVARLLGPGFLA
jgi:hypothetical protein